MGGKAAGLAGAVERTGLASDDATLANRVAVGCCRMTTLRSSLQSLADSFASSVLAAIRGANLEELLGEGGARRGPGRPPKSTSATAPSRPRKSRRLARRSAADIAKALDRVVALVKAAKNTGLRAEQIRVALAMQAKEMPRVLGEGLATKKLRAKGNKRATTYFAA